MKLPEDGTELVQGAEEGTAEGGADEPFEEAGGTAELGTDDGAGAGLLLLAREEPCWLVTAEDGAAEDGAADDDLGGGGAAELPCEGLGADDGCDEKLGGAPDEAIEEAGTEADCEGAMELPGGGGCGEPPSLGHVE
jgi:hypothetical protein